MISNCWITVSESVLNLDEMSQLVYEANECDLELSVEGLGDNVAAVWMTDAGKDLVLGPSSSVIFPFFLRLRLLS
jgi:hypothetical protein